MMYKCENCNEVFDESDADKVHTTYESEYGVSGEFASSTPYSYLVCPYCKCDELEEYEDEEEDEE